LSLAPLVFAGTFAYSIYLIHAPILTFLFEYLLVPLKASTLQTFLLLSLAGFPTVMLASYIFFRFFEYPFLTKKPKAAIA
jgi:peptidoglycan/LPS O-acetylase OafA/YrhL